MVIGIDHDALLAGVVGASTHHSTSAAGRRAAALLPHRPDARVLWCVDAPTTTASNEWVVNFYSTTSNMLQSAETYQFISVWYDVTSVEFPIAASNDTITYDVTIAQWRHN